MINIILLIPKYTLLLLNIVIYYIFKNFLFLMIIVINQKQYICTYNDNIVIFKILEKLS